MMREPEPTGATSPAEYSVADVRPPTYSDGRTQVELRQYVGILWKWTWLILLCMALAGASAYFMTKRQPILYQDTTTLLINQASSVALQDYTSLMTGERLALTYAQLLTKRPVMEQVVKELNLDLPPDAVASRIAVSLVRDTQLITLRVVDDTPERATQIANSVPVVFSKINEQLQQSRYGASKQSLLKQMEEVKADIDSTQAAMDALRASPAPDLAQLTQMSDALVQYRTTYSGLLRSYEDIRVAEAQTMDTVTVVEPAVGASPVGRKTMTNTLLAVVVGAMVAVGVAFLIEYLDDTVKSPDDVERVTHLATLGAIINFKKFSPNGSGPITATRPKSSISEGYRVLRTNLQFSALGTRQSGALLLVTSAQPREGKTTSLVNLGVSLAQAGKRVLLVDTDLRRPCLHEHFGLTNEAGLTSLLLEREADTGKVIQRTQVPGLYVLATGRLPAQPAEVLSFPQTGALLDRLRSFADYVLLDSPPVLTVADASILAQKADGVVMIVEMGRTRTAAFQRGVAALEAVRARMIGVVLNKVTSGPGSYYYDHYYYYSHYYSEEDGSPTPRQKRKHHRPWWKRLLGLRSDKPGSETASGMAISPLSATPASAPLPAVAPLRSPPSAAAPPAAPDTATLPSPPESTP